MSLPMISGTAKRLLGIDVIEDTADPDLNEDDAQYQTPQKKAEENVIEKTKAAMSEMMYPWPTIQQDQSSWTHASPKRSL